MDPLPGRIGQTLPQQDHAGRGNQKETGGTAPDGELIIGTFPTLNLNLVSWLNLSQVMRFQLWPRFHGAWA